MPGYLKNKSILIVSPEPWDHIFVSKHHYAQHLAEDNKVFFLNPPRGKWGVIESEDSNLKIVNYQGFIKGLRFMPVLVQRLVISSVFKKLQRIINCELDIVWSFDNSVFFDFSSLPQHILTISHIVDLNQDFQFKKASKTAKICLGSTRYIVDRLKLYNPNSYFVHHGVNMSNGALNAVSLPGSNKRKAMYMGNLAMAYIDWEIIYEAASTNTNCDFIFVGSNGDVFDLHINRMHNWKRKLFDLDNVYTLSKVSSEEIPSYLKSADVLMLAYQEVHHQDQANPHKMMEYLLSGKPIIATFSEEYESLMNIISMSKQNKDWKALWENLDSTIEDWILKKSGEQTRAYALSNSYDMQLDRITSFIEKA